MLQRRNFRRVGLVVIVYRKWLFYLLRADCVLTCVCFVKCLQGFFCSPWNCFIFHQVVSYSFCLELSESFQFTKDKKSLPSCVLLYLLLIVPFVNCSSSFMPPGLMLCLPHLATFLSLLPHLHTFSLRSQRDSPACLLFQCFYFLQDNYCDFNFILYLVSFHSSLVSVTVFLVQELSSSISPSIFCYFSSLFLIFK